MTKEGERIYCLESEIHLDYEDKKKQEGSGKIGLVKNSRVRWRLGTKL